MNTGLIEARVNHTIQDPRYRLSKDAPEIVKHITARCRQVKHTWRVITGLVAGIVWTGGIKVDNTPKILWETQIQTNKVVTAN